MRDIRSPWLRACSLAHVHGRHDYDLPRTSVRRPERAGVPRSVAMKLTGHKTESIYARHAIVSEADLAEGAGKLAALAPRPAVPRKVVGLPTAGREAD